MAENQVNVYIFRHGETDFNRQRKYQGSLDIPLNETGIIQAKQLAFRLKELPLQRIVSSDLARAWKTAEIIAEFHRLPLETDSRLRESHMGLSEGALLDDLVTKYGQEFMDRWRSPFQKDYAVSMPEGEKKQNVLLRAMSALNDLALDAHRSQKSQIAVSTHGGVVRLVIHAIAPELSTPIPIPNCCCYHLGFNIINGESHWSFLGSF